MPHYFCSWDWNDCHFLFLHLGIKLKHRRLYDWDFMRGELSSAQTFGTIEEITADLKSDYLIFLNFHF